MNSLLKNALAAASMVLFFSAPLHADPGKGEPPIILAAFGTSTKAGIAYDIIGKRVGEAFPNSSIHWAFTSGIIRKKMNAKWEKEGSPNRLYSLDEVLETLRAQGVKKIVVQPLHIFPGEEFEEVLKATARFPDLTIETGGALFLKWEDMYDVVAALKPDFLPVEKGSNIIVAHGTPSTDKPSNIAILGLDRYLSKRFSNVFLGAVDGAVTRSDAIDAALAYPVKNARFIPLMLVAGDHIMNDIMGDEADSWKSELERGGIKSDCPTVKIDSEEYYKGLGFLPETSDIFIRMIRESLGRLGKTER
jgi:sirohydrochlorin cobaltochelatase